MYCIKWSIKCSQQQCRDKRYLCALCTLLFLIFLPLAVNKPVIESLERVSPTTVIVEWSQPPGGANVTGYVVSYYDGSLTWNQTEPATATSATITGLSNTISNDSISVMALSEQPYLPGRSTWKNIILCKSYLSIHKIDSITTM